MSSLPISCPFESFEILDRYQWIKLESLILVLYPVLHRLSAFCIFCADTMTFSKHTVKCRKHIGNWKIQLLMLQVYRAICLATFWKLFLDKHNQYNTYHKWTNNVFACAGFWGGNGQKFMQKGFLYYFRMTNKHLQECNPSKVVFIASFQELNDDRLRTSKRKPQRFYTLH